MVAMADRIHGLSHAEVIETSCIGNDDEWCQWTIRWQEESVSEAILAGDSLLEETRRFG